MILVGLLFVNLERFRKYLARILVIFRKNCTFERYSMYETKCSYEAKGDKEGLGYGGGDAVHYWWNIGAVALVGLVGC